MAGSSSTPITGRARRYSSATATCTEDKNNKIFRISVRSRGPVINHILERHHGGGHKFASGVRLQNSEEFDEIVKDLDAITKQYNEN